MASQEGKETVKLGKPLMTHLCSAMRPTDPACPFCVDFDGDWVGVVVRERLLARVHALHLRTHAEPCAVCMRVPS